MTAFFLFLSLLGNSPQSGEPVLLQVNHTDSFLIDSAQVLKFKFTMKPGFYYSIIAKGPDVELQCAAGREKFSAIGKSTAAMFKADSIPGNDSMSYFSVTSFSAIALVKIRILEMKKKIFLPPLRPADTGLYPMSYYNFFGGHTILPSTKKKSIKGHDGVDVCTAYEYAGHGLATGWMIDDPAVIAVAPGEVIKVTENICTLGGLVWVKHVLPIGTFTSLYAHLKDIKVKVGDKINQGNTIAHLLPEPVCKNGFFQHLHFEMWKWESTVWSGGYSNGGSGQIDPVPILFEE